MKPQKRTAADVLVCQEVQIHYKRPLFDTEKKINSSKDADAILRTFVDTDRIDFKEFFWVILVTNANQVISVSEIGIGCTSGVTVNTKEIYQLALLGNASGIIVAHNHPSGKLKASDADLRMTERLKQGSNLLDFKLLDHVIITSEGFLSLSDEGLI